VSQFGGLHPLTGRGLETVELTPLIKWIRVLLLQAACQGRNRLFELCSLSLAHVGSVLFSLVERAVANNFSITAYDKQFNKIMMA
jgi:hypothetical protein